MEMSSSFVSERVDVALSYTLSKTIRKYSLINDGKEFPFQFDRPHILNAQCKLLLTESMTRKGKAKKRFLNAVVSYSSGNMTTIPLSSYQGVLPPYWRRRSNGQFTPDGVTGNAYERKEMTGKNAFRMKDYFRIDLAYTMEQKFGNKNSSLSLSVFNVLNRHNAYLIFNDNGQWKQLSIMPVMPSLRWTLEF